MKPLKIAVLGLLLSATAANAQAPTVIVEPGVTCIATSDKRLMQCEGYINNDLALGPGAWKIELRANDQAGNPADVVGAGTVVIPTPDTEKPVIGNVQLIGVSPTMWRVIFTCTDNVECSGGSISVTKQP